MGQGLGRKECEEVQRNYRLDEDELDAWVRVFQRYCRRRRNNEMDFDGFCKAFAESGESRTNLQKIFAVFDWDKNGVISFNEFMFAVLVNSRVSSRVKLKFAFDMIDRDGNGEIDERELMDLVFRISSTKSMLMFDDETPISEELVHDTFRNMDTNGDGSISLDEFLEQVGRHGEWILKLLEIRHR
ncbi:hypothetical protein BOX15_Mlig007184g3 [Macrostomum lignano]|uniref:EF-hand domain-containing protein n=1 Tax=Macrostomum lignano TaxID=282301 RepID=A0A267EGQ8_9PLAT|nr:hypothetical protein BOX15_Mlig007184g3 [Macrostomum lignano]